MMIIKATEDIFTGMLVCIDTSTLTASLATGDDAERDNMLVTAGFHCYKGDDIGFNPGSPYLIKIHKL